MLNKVLLPTAYLAPISYYAILLQLSDWQIEHHENFIKQSIRNRCEIYGANKKLRLTIPKKRHKSHKTIITDITISYEEKWQKKHWNSIVSSYNSSPFFEYYKDEIQPAFEKKEKYLIDFNNKLQEIILTILQVNVQYNASTKYNYTGNFYDMRNHNFSNNDIKRYDQVFMEKNGFIANLSILDLLFNLGPESTEYLNNLNICVAIENSR